MKNKQEGGCEIKRNFGETRPKIHVSFFRVPLSMPKRDWEIPALVSNKYVGCSKALIGK